MEYADGYTPSNNYAKNILRYDNTKEFFAWFPTRTHSGRWAWLKKCVKLRTTHLQLSFIQDNKLMQHVERVYTEAEFLVASLIGEVEKFEYNFPGRGGGMVE